MDDEQRKPTAKPRLEARYANYFEVGSNASEVVLVCGQHYDDQETPLMHTRIITQTQRARELVEVLRTALDRLGDETETGGGTGGAVERQKPFGSGGETV